MDTGKQNLNGFTIAAQPYIDLLGLSQIIQYHISYVVIVLYSTCTYIYIYIYIRIYCIINIVIYIRRLVAYIAETPR